VRVDGTVYHVEIDGGHVTVGGEEVFVETLNAEMPGKPRKDPIRLLCQADGLVYQIKKDEGDVLKAGDTIMILESLKMEMAVKCPRDGILDDILVRPDDTVRAGQVLAVVKPE
jgi:biotin carboxyl carrier protein